MGFCILVVDIGNTSITVGVARADRIIRTARLPAEQGADASRIESLLRHLTRSTVCDDAVLCSVVPRLNSCWQHILCRHTGRKPLLVSHRLRLGVRVDYPHPETIGADRLANAAAAWKRYGKAAVVADFGTALTFDVVTRDGRYVGGVIAPGLPLMTDYLCERTALLPHIRVARVRRVIGRSTREAMCVGATVGYRGMVREIFQAVVKESGDRHAALCATGGYSARAIQGLGLKVAVLPNLTLDGLVVIHQLNRQPGQG